MIIKNAEREYRSLNRQTALTQRNTFNEELAVANAIQMNSTKENVLKRIVYIEQVREQSRMSRHYCHTQRYAYKNIMNKCIKSLFTRNIYY